jgi:type IV secretory pathway protease TraF
LFHWTPDLGNPVSNFIDGRSPPIEGAVVVPLGFVWLVVPMDQSFDSRYLGPVRTSSIIAIADPLLVE